MDISFHLDEAEAKIYGFLEKNAHEAFTSFEIYVNVFVEPMFRHLIREDSNGEDYIGHPLYESVKKSLEAMVKEEKISGRRDQRKFYYIV